MPETIEAICPDGQVRNVHVTPGSSYVYVGKKRVTGTLANVNGGERFTPTGKNASLVGGEWDAEPEAQAGTLTAADGTKFGKGSFETLDDIRKLNVDFFRQDGMRLLAKIYGGRMFLTGHRVRGGLAFTLQVVFDDGRIAVVVGDEGRSLGGGLTMEEAIALAQKYEDALVVAPAPVLAELNSV